MVALTCDEEGQRLERRWTDENWECMSVTYIGQQLWGRMAQDGLEESLEFLVLFLELLEPFLHLFLLAVQRATQGLDVAPELPDLVFVVAPAVMS